MPTLGFFTVVYNDPQNLVELLDLTAAAEFDQVVVVHDGPDAAGCGLAKSYTENAIAPFYRQGWGKAVYQIAMQLMTTDWIFHLDVDERPLPGTLAMLRDLVAQAEAAGDIDAWQFLRREADDRTSQQTRLFQHGIAYYIDVPHTQVQGVVNPILAPVPPEGHHITHDRDAGDLARAGKGGDWHAFAAKMVRYAIVQAALRIKYHRHPELLAPGCALGIDYSIIT